METKFKGIIPELKINKGTKCVEHYIKKLEPYPVVSVNTSGLFNGHIGLIYEVRRCYPKKFILRKDFIMTQLQINESIKAGANGVLLIKYFLDAVQLSTLLSYCKKKKIVPFVEIRAIDTSYLKDPGYPIVVNSRSLNSGRPEKELAETICLTLKGKSNVIYASGEESDRILTEKKADGVIIDTGFMQEKI